MDTKDIFSKDESKQIQFKTPILPIFGNIYDILYYKNNIKNEMISRNEIAKGIKGIRYLLKIFNFKSYRDFEYYQVMKKPLPKFFRNIHLNHYDYKFLTENMKSEYGLDLSFIYNETLDYYIFGELTIKNDNNKFKQILEYYDKLQKRN